MEFTYKILLEIKTNNVTQAPTTFILPDEMGVWQTLGVEFLAVLGDQPSDITSVSRAHYPYCTRGCLELRTVRSGLCTHGMRSSRHGRDIYPHATWGCITRLSSRVIGSDKLIKVHLITCTIGTHAHLRRSSSSVYLHECNRCKG